jgi:hypothetical protein
VVRQQLSDSFIWYRNLSEYIRFCFLKHCNGIRLLLEVIRILVLVASCRGKHNHGDVTFKRYPALYLIQPVSVNHIVLAKPTAIAGRGPMMSANNLVDLKDNVFVIVSVKCSSNVFLVMLGRCLSRNHNFGVFFFLLGSLSLIFDFFLSFHQLEACEICR